MKSIKALDEKPVKKPIDGRKLISIDPSSNSLAFAVYNGKKDNIYLIAAGKIHFPRNSNTVDRAKIINSSLKELIERYEPDSLVVEETIYIQNPQTSRVLAYVVGLIFGKATDMDVNVIDVGPLKWKAFIGYQNVRKTEITEWTKQYGEKEAKKKASFERKERTRRIIWKMFPLLEEEDHDIIDAIAIGYWAIHNT
jgi:Holliday junction resolvasome RuvABC endonuclease subunit